MFLTATQYQPYAAKALRRAWSAVNVPDAAHPTPTNTTKTAHAFSAVLISCLCREKVAAAGKIKLIAIVMKAPTKDCKQAVVEH